MNQRPHLHKQYHVVVWLSILEVRIAPTSVLPIYELNNALFLWKYSFYLWASHLAYLKFLSTFVNRKRPLFPGYLPPALLCPPRWGFEDCDDIGIVAHEVTEDQHEVGFGVAPELDSRYSLEQNIYSVVFPAHIVVHKWQRNDRHVRIGGIMIPVQRPAEFVCYKFLQCIERKNMPMVRLMQWVNMLRTGEVNPGGVGCTDSN